MSARAAAGYRDVAEAAWGWVLDQVRWQDGPWIPESVPVPVPVPGSEVAAPPPYRDGLAVGIGGLAQVLAEIRLGREWTAAESRLAAAIGQRLLSRVAVEEDCTFFDGLVSTLGVLTALDLAGAQAAVDRLTVLATPDGWAQTSLGPPRFWPGTRINDLTLGTAGVLLGAVWAGRAGLARATELAELAAAVLIAEMESRPTGVNWRFVPRRFRADAGAEMPNFSHGLAGIATALALAGNEFDRPDLTGAAVRGAEHLVTLGRPDGAGFVVPRRIPHGGIDADEVTYNWCHGAAGTSLLFAALHRIGVADIAGSTPLVWQRRCLHSVRTSGLPARRHPGFWDNDGQCCGTAGVGEIFLDAWQRFGNPDDREFALRLADTLVERAVVEPPHAYWRFTEHRADDPLLPPGVGWNQGAAGIAAFLFRASRILRDGPDAAPVPRMDTWWAQRS